MNQKQTFENKNLGQVKVRSGEIWNAVQISEDTVRMWKGQNDSFFMRLDHFQSRFHMNGGLEEWEHVA